MRTDAVFPAKNQIKDKKINEKKNEKNKANK